MSFTLCGGCFAGQRRSGDFRPLVGRLEAHFGNVALQKVRYAEPQALGRTLTLDDVAILKRPFFDFEKEARAIFRNDTPNPKLDKGEFGFQFPFDPAEILESVAIHPEADISFYETVLWAIDDHAKPLRDNVSWSSMRGTSSLPEATALPEMTVMTAPDENAPYMRALRAYERERQEQFAAEVDAIPFDVSALRRAMSQARSRRYPVHSRDCVRLCRH